MSEKNDCMCHQIGPGTFPVDDPDGSKARAELSQNPLFNIEPCFVGLDLSLTGTGFCLKMGNQITIETISTKPKDFANNLDRLIHIRDKLLSKIPMSVKMICVEDFFTPSNSMQIGSAIKLAMLGTVIRIALYEKGLPFVIIAPNSLKKHITGTGAGQKSMIVREVFKKYGINAEDDNQADAVVLCAIAEHIYKIRSGLNTDDMTKYQKEVTSKIIDTPERLYNLS